MKFAVFATAWGPVHGGINSFNRDFCIGLATCLPKPSPIVCVVRQASRLDEEDAARHGVTLLNLRMVDANPYHELDWEAFSLEHRRHLTTSTHLVFHDTSSGALALRKPEYISAKYVVFHHMSYAGYQHYKHPEEPDEAADKYQLQKLIMTKVDAVVAVGDLLRESADALLGSKSPTSRFTFYPGFPDLPECSPRSTMTAISMGRMSDDHDDRIKMSSLALHSWSSAVQIANEIDDLKPLVREPTFYLLGFDDSNSEYGRSITIPIEQELYKAGLRARLLPLRYRLPPSPNAQNPTHGLLGESWLAFMLSWHEGFGLSGLEALATGTPLIFSQNSGLFQYLQRNLDPALSKRLMALNIKGTAPGSPAPHYSDDDKRKVQAVIVNFLYKRNEYRECHTAIRNSLRRQELTWASQCNSLCKGLSDWNPVPSVRATPLLNAFDDDHLRPTVQGRPPSPPEKAALGEDAIDATLVSHLGFLRDPWHQFLHYNLRASHFVPPRLSRQAYTGDGTIAEKFNLPGINLRDLVLPKGLRIVVGSPEGGLYSCVKFLVAQSHLGGDDTLPRCLPVDLDALDRSLETAKLLVRQRAREFNGRPAESGATVLLCYSRTRCREKSLETLAQLIEHGEQGAMIFSDASRPEELSSLKSFVNPEDVYFLSSLEPKQIESIATSCLPASLVPLLMTLAFRVRFELGENIDYENLAFLIQRAVSGRDSENLLRTELIGEYVNAQFLDRICGGYRSVRGLRAGVTRLLTNAAQVLNIDNQGTLERANFEAQLLKTPPIKLLIDRQPLVLDELYNSGLLRVETGRVSFKSPTFASYFVAARISKRSQTLDELMSVGDKGLVSQTLLSAQEMEPESNAILGTLAKQVSLKDTSRLLNKEREVLDELLSDKERFAQLRDEMLGDSRTFGLSDTHVEGKPGTIPEQLMPLIFVVSQLEDYIRTAMSGEAPWTRSNYPICNENGFAVLLSQVAGKAELSSDRKSLGTLVAGIRLALARITERVIGKAQGLTQQAIAEIGAELPEEDELEDLRFLLKIHGLTCVLFPLAGALAGNYFAIEELRRMAKDENRSTLLFLFATALANSFKAGNETWNVIKAMGIKEPEWHLLLFMVASMHLDSHDEDKLDRVEHFEWMMYEIAQKAGFKRDRTAFDRRYRMRERRVGKRQWR